ncbi:putative iron-regulated membrane protein [Azospirillum fermentarium]|uniref:PepSY-associated TM helix domain-containing protein n=1 Tax=Azospirillum fermentarium TaxID=1233114 RepID=UPI002226D18D|nr:PepSY-associated TM helix domain-containing protein [Azospirillum fermentarium]MCW2249064.1 putative iron-regulated membrane protein [Azospirillum fermentarium]
MRQAVMLLHRWFGLGAALFLFLAGSTGAVISWDHELDGWLNPHLHHSASQGPPLDALEAARRVEARDPRIRVTYLPLAAEPGETLPLFVQPKVDPATGRLFEPGYNQLFLDPVTGEEVGRREWGQAWPITTETLISFLYQLHYSLHIPEIGGIDRWGVWLMGVIALGWVIDCFGGFSLTLPARRTAGAGGRTWWARWSPAWTVKAGSSAYRITLDIHRAFSLWTWAVLFILAFTAFSLNLYREAFMPLMTLVSQPTPTPFDTRPRAPLHQPIEPVVPLAAAVAAGQAEAARRGWEEPVGAVGYSPSFGFHIVGFFHPGGDHGAAGVGPAQLYFDGADGRLLGEHLPWTGTAADLFIQAQFPLHSGRILGLPGRILISVMGIVVAVVSVTGVVIWWRKRASRTAVRVSRTARA